MFRFLNVHKEVYFIYIVYSLRIKRQFNNNYNIFIILSYKRINNTFMDVLKLEYIIVTNNVLRMLSHELRKPILIYGGRRC